jgi:hypothetical protein
MATLDPNAVAGKVSKITSNSSRAMLSRKVVVHSLQAQRVIWRNFEKLRQSLFSIAVYLPLSHSEEEVKQIDNYIDTEFEKVQTELNTSHAQISKILKEDLGVDELVEFSNPMELEIKLDTPRINRFLQLVLMLDDLMRMVETMWLCTQISQAERGRQVFTWQQRLIKLSARIIGMEQRIRSSAKNKGVEVDEEQGSDNFNFAEESDKAEAEEILNNNMAGELGSNDRTAAKAPKTKASSSPKKLVEESIA